MIFRGVIENTFGGALCFRGFAKIGDLAEISAPNFSYQRNADEFRSKEILEFLKNGKYRYFPELTFGLQIPDSSAIQNFISGKKAIFSNGIKFNSYTKDFNDYRNSDKFESPLLRRISIDFPNSIKNLTRIDGNHRLSAVDSLDFTNPIESEQLNYLVPFSIIIQQESDDSRKYENAYFHLINSKSKPLTSEENLKSILDNSTFNDSEIIEIIGKNGIKAKNLVNKINSYQFQGIQEILKDNLRSFSIGCFGVLENETVEDVLRAIQSVDVLYSENEKLKEFNSIEILLSLIYYKIKGKMIYNHFIQWIIGNHMFNLKEVKAISIIEIYNKIHQKKIYKVFVAMPYWSHHEITEYNTLFREVLTNIEKKANIQLELIPIMRFRGKSQRIDQRLIDLVEECDIFIADITGNNINVIFEIGYAEAKSKPMILIKEEKDKTKVPFDMDKLQYIPYPKAGYYNAIKNTINLNLSEILKKDFNIIF